MNFGGQKIGVGPNLGQPAASDKKYERKRGHSNETPCGHFEWGFVGGSMTIYVTSEGCEISVRVGQQFKILHWGGEGGDELGFLLVGKKSEIKGMTTWTKIGTQDSSYSGDTGSEAKKGGPMVASSLSWARKVR